MHKMVFISYQQRQEVDSFSIEYVLLAMQRALLNEVTPELRAVAVDFDPQQLIFYTAFYYEGEPSEKMIDLWDCAITEASADLGHCFIQSQIDRLDYPQDLPACGYYVYLRKEPNISTNKKRLQREVQIKEKTLADALIAAQQSLLGVVTPTLRAVVVDFHREKSILYMRYYYDGIVLDELLQLWEIAIVETHTRFGLNCSLDAAVERLDYPQSVPNPPNGRYIYFRKEERPF